MTQHLDSYILLTSKQKFPRLVGRYCSYLLPTQALSTFILMSTEYRNQGAVSPCTRTLLPFCSWHAELEAALCVSGQTWARSCSSSISKGMRGLQLIHQIAWNAKFFSWKIECKKVFLIYRRCLGIRVFCRDRDRDARWVPGEFPEVDLVQIKVDIGVLCSYCTGFLEKFTSRRLSF